MMPEPSKPTGPRCQPCNSDSFCNGAVWKCSACKRTLGTASDYQIAAQKTYDIYERQHRHDVAAGNDEILLGQLVQGQILQLGISLIVAQNVWHWKKLKIGETKIWMVDDIIEVLKVNDTIVIADIDGSLGDIKGEKLGFTGSLKRRVHRNDYVQTALLLAAQTVDIHRQLRASE